MSEEKREELSAIEAELAVCRDKVERWQQLARLQDQAIQAAKKQQADLAAAKAEVERLRNYLRWPDRFDRGLFLEALTFVSIYIAEHPADDETPITELWWCDMNGGSRFMYLSEERLMLYLAVDGMIELCVTDGGGLKEISRDLPHIKTRGDVRRLLKALGVEFNS